MVKISLDQAKRIRFELLLEIDTFCKEQNLTYFLAFGTLLGAVRHHGFIPWDDDCDIMMPRPDLERFLKEYPENDRFEAISNKSGRGQVWGFGRLVDKRTYRDQHGWRFPGINVEIYPIDGAPSTEIGQKTFLFGIKLFQFLERHVVKVTNDLINSNRWLFKSPECLITKMLIYSFYYYGTYFDYKKSNEVAIIFGNPYKKKYFNKSIFLKSTELQFEDNYFKVPKGYNQFLSEIYGDYMTPPPVDKRTSHGGDYYYY